MKRFLLTFMTVCLLVLVVSGVSWSWQGRMAGIEDPYGLVADESDFLIHPAKIAKGSGVKIYGDYRFTYTDVKNWNYTLNELTPAGALIYSYQYDTSGKEYKNNALLGVAFPLGTGRMGVFFAYDRTRGNYDGHEAIPGLSDNYLQHELSEDLDNFALKLIYGMPVGRFNLGGEIQLAYRQEKQTTWINAAYLGEGITNYPWGANRVWLNVYPYMIPYDSKYWETLFKGSLDGKVGPLDLAFTLRGGFVFSGGNKYSYDFQIPVGNSVSGVNMDGAVSGWKIGGDFWLRYPITQTLTLPFLVRVDYQSKTRDGSGNGNGGLSAYSYNHEQKERNLDIVVGGGIDKTFSQKTRVATGIYYSYHKGTEDIRQWGIETAPFVNDHSYPDANEHRVMLKLIGEHELSPTVTLRLGFEPFFGRVSEDFKYSHGTSFNDDISLDGNHWGVGTSLGASIKLKPVTLEPFLNVGYQSIKLDGDGTEISGGAIAGRWEMDKSRAEWYAVGGLSVLFGQ